MFGSAGRPAWLRFLKHCLRLGNEEVKRINMTAQGFDARVPEVHHAASRAEGVARERLTDSALAEASARLQAAQRAPRTASGSRPPRGQAGA